MSETAPASPPADPLPGLPGHLLGPLGPRGWPLLGNLPAYRADPLAFLTYCAREHGDAVRLRLPGIRAVLLSHPESIEQVLRGEHRNFKKDSITRRTVSFLGQGLLTSEGEFWRRQRQLAQPAFQHSQIQSYGPMITACVDRLLAGWRPGELLDVHAEMSGLALDVIARTLFDSDVAEVAAEIRDGLEAVMRYFLNPAASWSVLGDLAPTPAAFRYRRARRRLDAIILGIIRRQRAAPRPGGGLLSRLLSARDERGQAMTDAELRDELVTLFLAGHETTALALTWCFLLLARHPAAESRLVEELQTVLAGRTPMAEDLPRLPFTEAVVKETMRLYPPAWIVGREAVVECRVGGYRIAPGTQLWMSQWVVHRDPRWFDAADEFRPQRWQDDLARRLPRCAYFPFGDGPRICIGAGFAMLEAVLALAAIVQRFRLTLAADQTIALAPSITLRPKYGLKAIVQVRCS